MSLYHCGAIESLALRLIDRSLPKAEWTHEGHFAAALWLSKHRRDLTAPDEIRTLITGYNEATGTANTASAGYHHTITLASMRAATDLIDRCGATTPIHQVLRSLMASKLGDRDWLLRHWRRDTLFGTTARRRWVEPDLTALPF